MITQAYLKYWLTKIYNDNIGWEDLHNALTNNLFMDNHYHTCNFNKVKGDIFEYLTKYIFLYDGYSKVYLYNEIPYELKQQLNLPNNDHGIDLIISKDGKDWVGVQCKWRTKFSCVIEKRFVTEFMHEINNSNLSYGIFFTNVKKCLDDYLKYKEKTKDKQKLKYSEWKVLLFSYCNENKCVPSQRTIYRTHKVGSWLCEQKKRIKDSNSEVYKDLSTNEYVKKSLDNYLSKKI